MIITTRSRSPEEQKGDIWHPGRLGRKEAEECDRAYRCHHDDGQEPQEPDNGELNAIDKKVHPPGEFGGWF